jgi:hypothetical protein
MTGQAPCDLRTTIGALKQQVQTVSTGLRDCSDKAAVEGIADNDLVYGRLLAEGEVLHYAASFVAVAAWVLWMATISDSSA